MVNTKAVIIITLFVALIGVILSVTAAPVQRVHRRGKYIMHITKTILLIIVVLY